MTPLMVIGVPAGLDGIGAPPAGFGAAGIGSAEAGAVMTPPLPPHPQLLPQPVSQPQSLCRLNLPFRHAQVSMRYAAFTVDPPGGRRRGAAAGRPISPWPATRSGRPVWVRNLIVPAGLFHPGKAGGEFCQCSSTGPCAELQQVSAV